MLILQEKTTPLNLQFLSVGNEFDSSLIGRYAVVNLSNKRSFICKVWPKSFLHNDFCVLDPSVELLSNSSTPAAKELNLEGQHLSRNNVKAISHVNIIKSLSLIVVFKDPWQRLKWDNKEAALIDSLRELLKLFIISSKSIVNVDSLTEFDIFGIYSLNILSTGCGYGRVVKSTKIKIDSKISLMTYDQLYRNVDENEIFYWNAYKDLNAVIENRANILNPDRSLILNQETEDENLTFVQQVLLVGAGGCGKSTLVHKVCFDNEVVLLYLDLSEMLMLKHDEKQLYFKDKLKLAKALSDEATSGICMILIKRIENISSRSGRPLEMLNSFLEDASRDPKIIVVATTDFPLALDASLRSANKFSVEVYLNIPTETERFRLVEVIVRQLPYKINLSGRSCLYIALNTPGFVFADLVLLFRKATKTVQSQNITEEDDILNVFKSCVKTVQPTSTKGIIGLVPSSNYNINNLGGLFEIKSKLIQLIVWPIVNSEALRQMNVPPPSGCLLYGPPGCAKTSLVRAVASSYKTTFLSVSAAHLYSPFLGDAEKIITQLFQRARSSAPTVLFIDEIDALVGTRTNRDSGVQERILSSFLTELDGIGFKKDAELSLNENYNPIVTIVAATNRPQAVDSALLRPGRFDKLIYVPPPNVEERLSILKIVTGGLSLDSNISLPLVAERTEYYSGADLVSLCREAGLRALAVGGEKVQSISVADFDYAMENIKPSLSEEQVKWYSEFTFG